MFGPYQFGEPYFAKAINLNGTVVKRVTEQVVYPCRKRECATTPDIEIYSLQDALKFNADALSVIVNCPPGFICPDGLFPLVVTYPPGTFYLPDPQTPGFPILMTMQGCKSVVTITLPATATQAEIDAAAQQLILQIAAQQAECDAEEQYGPFTPQPPAGAVQFGQLSDNIICLGVGTFVAIPMTSTYTPVTTAITGSIPTGMTGSQTADSLTNLISGTPTVAGDYSFSIKASPPFTNPVIQNFVLTVFGITNAASLTAYTVGSAYSETLVTGGTVIGPVTFEVTDGSLPAGLSLDENTGEIYGTPTAEGTSNFTVTVTDLGSTVACSKAFTIGSVAGGPEYTVRFANAGILQSATINGYDFTTGQPPDGTLLQWPVNVDWVVAANPPQIGYTIAFDLTFTSEAATYRFSVDNSAIVPNTLNTGTVEVKVGAISQWIYDLSTTTGVGFVDIPLSAGESVEVIFSADGVTGLPSPDGTYSTELSVQKL